MLVLELMPSALARELAQALPLPVIGIGAGSGCAGQVLVLHDMLGLGAAPGPRFVRNFLADGGSVQDAVRRYVAAVKDGSFPDESAHTY
jgi:3-methyl-2-oxobutanoate hydroxymethyltransferase